MKIKSDSLIMLVGAGIALYVFTRPAKAAGGSTIGNVQTATVGNRVYSVVRLGQGNYLVSLVSSGGVLETTPVNYTFSQAGALGSIGDPAKVAQLQSDLPAMGVTFS